MPEAEGASQASRRLSPRMAWVTPQPMKTTTATLNSDFSVSGPDCAGLKRLMPLAGLRRDQFKCSASGAKFQPP